MKRKSFIPYLCFFIMMIGLVSSFLNIEAGTAHAAIRSTNPPPANETFQACLGRKSGWTALASGFYITVNELTKGATTAYDKALGQYETWLDQIEAYNTQLVNLHKQTSAANQSGNTSAFLKQQAQNAIEQIQQQVNDLYAQEQVIKDGLSKLTGEDFTTAKQQITDLINQRQAALEQLNKLSNVIAEATEDSLQAALAQEQVLIEQQAAQQGLTNALDQRSQAEIKAGLAAENAEPAYMGRIGAATALVYAALSMTIDCAFHTSLQMNGQDDPSIKLAYDTSSLGDVANNPEDPNLDPNSIALITPPDQNNQSTVPDTITYDNAIDA